MAMKDLFKKKKATVENTADAPVETNTEQTEATEAKPEIYKMTDMVIENKAEGLTMERFQAVPSIPKGKATRKELRQMNRAKKQEAAIKRQRMKNKLEYESGGKERLDPSEIRHKSIWEKIAEPQMYALLREMGNPTKAIDKFQRKRVTAAMVFLLIGLAVGFFIHPWLYLVGPVFGFIVYKMKMKTVQNMYRMWKFERQLNFSKFTRLVIPYLKASGGSVALYTIFNKILKRTENETDRKNLYQLMGEMGDRPRDIQPFLDYAERSSGTDMSHLFMSTIFDFQQSTFDVSVIDELGKLASEEMMAAIDEIINMKLKRFSMFPTKVVMSTFILIAGLTVGLFIHSLGALDFGAVSIDPATAIEESADE